MSSMIPVLVDGRLDYLEEMVTPERAEDCDILQAGDCVLVGGPVLCNDEPLSLLAMALPECTVMELFERMRGSGPWCGLPLILNPL